MKRTKVDIKKTIKKRIEHRHNDNKYVQKGVKMNDKTLRRIYGNKPIPVELISRQERRMGQRIGIGIASSETIFYDINVSAYPRTSYIKTLESQLEVKPTKILFLISNYEREKMLVTLLDEIKAINSEQITADYIIFDDVSSYTLDDPKFIINSEHRGKFNYWRTFDDMFKYCEQNYYDIYVFSPNDFHKYNMNKIIEYGIKLAAQPYFFNTLNDGRTTCWNRTKPIKLTNDINQIFFSDCGFVTNQLGLKALEFKMLPINTTNPNISSQVGKQITNRLNMSNIPIFHPVKSLVYHGNHPSVMHARQK